MDLNSKFYNFVQEFQVILNTLSMNNKKYKILTKEENLAKQQFMKHQNILPHSSCIVIRFVGITIMVAILNVSGD
jgi:hypothetical protein